MATIQMSTTTYRIFTLSGRGLPADCDSEGYDTHAAASAQAEAFHDGEYRVEAQLPPTYSRPQTPDLFRIGSLWAETIYAPTDDQVVSVDATGATLACVRTEQHPQRGYHQVTTQVHLSWETLRSYVPGGDPSHGGVWPTVLVPGGGRIRYPFSMLSAARAALCAGEEIWMADGGALVPLADWEAQQAYEELAAGSA